MKTPLLALTTALAFALHGPASALPIAVPLSSDFGEWNWSTTPDGALFTVTTTRHGGGLLYRTAKDVSQALTLVSHPHLSDEDEFSERVKLNPDGRFILNFRGADLVVRNLESGAEVWHGVLPGLHQPHKTSAVYYRDKDRRLQVLSGNTLHTFALDEDGVTTSALAKAEVGFPKPGHPLTSDFVRDGVFTPDGGNLFVGTLEGDLLIVETLEQEPGLLARLRGAFALPTGPNADIEDLAVNRLRCSENCRYIVMESANKRQFGIFDTVDGKRRGHFLGDGSYRLTGIGNGLFVLFQHERGDGLQQRVVVMDADLKTIATLPELVGTNFAFGFKGGVAALVSGTDRKNLSLVFLDVQGKLVEARHLDAEERQRAAALERRLPEFRRQLRSGDDSHCGLVIARKGEIALVETPIGQKWLKVRQLYPMDAHECKFVAGVLQDGE